MANEALKANLAKYEAEVAEKIAKFPERKNLKYNRSRSLVTSKAVVGSSAKSKRGLPLPTLPA